MIERINDFMARRFGVGTNVASFVRIHVWAIAFLIVISMLLPSRQVDLRRVLAPNVRTQKVTLPYNDPRGYAPSPYPKDAFHIAWIAGSETRFVNESTGQPDYLPNLALANLPPEIDGREVVVDFYFIDAMRLGDIYFSLLDALEADPDMVVVSLNPAWVLNPVATHQWTQFDNRAAVQLLTKPKAWPLAAGLFSPSDLAWGLANDTLDVFRDRWYYNYEIHQKVDELGPLDLHTLPSAIASQEPTRSDELLGMLPIDFWAKYRLHKPRAATAERWAEWVDLSNEGKSGLNKNILGLIADRLRDSGVPSYVYAAPVNSDWYATVPAIKSATSGVERQLEQLRSKFSAPNIRYQPLDATRFVPPLHFLDNDLMHLIGADPMGPYLAGELCRLVHQVHERSDCTVEPAEAPG